MSSGPASGFMSSISYIYFEKSMMTATLVVSPERLVPAPRDSTGAPCFWQISIVATTSSSSFGITTPNGTCR